MNPTAELASLNIYLDEAPLSAEYEVALENVVVKQALCLPSCCELTFSAPEVGSLDGISLGTELSIVIDDQERRFFVGEVTACRYHYGLRGQQQLVVRSYDILHRLRKRQQLRQFEDIELSSLIEEVLSDLEVDVEFHGNDFTIEQVLQWQQSDLALLTNMAQRYGKYFSLWDDVLQVFSVEGLEQDITLSWGEGLLSVNVELNADPACRTVEVIGWNPKTAEKITGEAGIVGGSSSMDDSTHPGYVGVTGERYLTSQTVSSEEEANALGEAMLQRRVSGEAVVKATADGSEKLRPGARVTLDKIATEVMGEYTITSVTHNFDRAQGYVCELDSSPPPLATKQTTTSSMGVVIDIDDPESMGRVRVAYPDLGMLESLWLEVVFPGAGDNKGLIALPDVEDKVLVLFIGGEPTQGVVIGGLYGDQGPPDNGIENGSVKRYTFVTPNGQKLSLDDVDDTIKLENNDGSYVMFTSGKMKIHAETDLTIEAPGKNLVISANSIDFKQS